MKIAVAAAGEQVSMHFGHCKNFVVFEVEGEKIINSEIVPSPNHGHGVLPGFLAKLGVDLVISGGMGSGAFEKLKQKEIKVITGADGLAKEAAESYLRGELKSAGVGCKGHGHHNHEHRHSHGEHCSCGKH